MSDADEVRARVRAARRRLGIAPEQGDVFTREDAELFVRAVQDIEWLLERLDVPNARQVWLVFAGEENDVMGVYASRAAAEAEWPADHMAGPTIEAFDVLDASRSTEATDE